MVYCSNSLKARIDYIFGNGAKDSYQTSQTPIDVTVTFSGNQTDEWLVVGEGVLDSCKSTGSVYSGSCDVKPIVSNGFYYFGSSDTTCPVVYVTCNGRNIIGEEFGFFPGTVKVIPPGKSDCELKVFSRNQLLFSVSGECPITYTVACDDECPEGYLKCPTTKYPGYCCIPCKTVAAELAAMKLKLRKINHG